MKDILGIIVIGIPFYILFGLCWYFDGFTNALYAISVLLAVVLGIFITTFLGLKIIDT